MEDARYLLIEEHPGYRVGDDGSFWSRKRRGTSGVFGPWQRIKATQQKQRGGYLQVGMYEGDQRSFKKVHVLVLEAFVGECPQGHEARHLDGNPANNRLSNLAWGTPEENHADKEVHGRVPRGGCHANAKLTQQQVDEIRRRRPGETLSRLATEFGVSDVLISQIANGKSWRGAPMAVSP